MALILLMILFSNILTILFSRNMLIKIQRDFLENERKIKKARKWHEATAATASGSSFHFVGMTMAINNSNAIVD